MNWRLPESNTSNRLLIFCSNGKGATADSLKCYEASVSSDLRTINTKTQATSSPIRPDSHSDERLSPPFLDPSSPLFDYSFRRVRKLTRTIVDDALLLIQIKRASAIGLNHIAFAVKSGSLRKC
ncbi:hypothetical protein L6452_21342 [Arctium lappa]|uniref:Uncharacterized protein n=1 Tax=Arctium lappa TaxID=4217 RepID=A0ACB9BDU7_ARCLA|nr:hypothetical protein L6452_21342 [Arctium lappa]